MKASELRNIIDTSRLDAEKLGRLCELSPKTIESMANGRKEITGKVIYQLILANLI